MKKEIKDKWVAALRSGEYKQTKGYLKVGDEYCCLGVLCELSGLGKFKLVEKAVTDGVELFDDGYHTPTKMPPLTVTKWAGIESSDYEIIDPHTGKQNLLSSLNDDGRTFDEIADVIEAQWEAI